jgi:hypothetical protein
MSGEYPNGNTAIGENALIDAVNTSSRDNSAFGINALTNLNPGTNENTALGAEALRANQTGENTAVGAYASSRVSGTHNTSLGNWALRYNAGGDANTAVGHRAMAGTLTETDPVVTPSGDRNTAVGSNALRGNNKGDDNTAIGYNVLYNNFNASNNTGVGSGSLKANTSGARNTALGADALTNNTTGRRNVGLGTRSLESLTTGQSNSAVGRRAMGGATTGSSNSSLGHRTGDSLTAESNNTLLGANSDIVPGVSFGTAVGAGAIVGSNNSIVLGRVGVDKVGIGVSDPMASLHIGGGICNKVIQFIGGLAYNATINDYIVITDAPSVVFPSTGSVAEGHTFVVKSLGVIVTVSATAGSFYDTGVVASIIMPANSARTFVHSMGIYYVVTH